ncbi:MAG: MotA/TolQ/ExbB proton channel family protein [Candidatus Omnitrophica bacterium]|nr:MotA/TolQ/ExbB proton channel family protein [Candidatus Omnitrophota bacterium]MBU1871376.1 MotA/TolQ/ExbB proton channel family protein [Candidatus Omnitrophota bacterium]
MWQMFLKGGPVMWPILLCSVFAVAIIIERIWYLRKIRIDTRQFLNKILERMKRHQIKEAMELCEAVKNPLSQLLKAGILKYDRGRQQIKEAIEDAALYEEPRLEKNMTALATIAHISPLLGLLGTVLGMVRSFQIIQAKTTALVPVSPGDLAGGIWEALLTTVAGLVVAIPAFVAYNYLVSRIGNFILEMERASTELVNFLTE